MGERGKGAGEGQRGGGGVSSSPQSEEGREEDYNMIVHT